jgi:acetyl esterase/lipase
VAVLIHGGFWRARYGLDLEHSLAADLLARGWTVWNVEYRRIGDGGGWPETYDDVRAAISALPVAADRVVAIGHSAGGHLAAWLAHRGSLRAGTAGSVGPGESHVPIVGAVTQAGLLDLVSASVERLGNGAVTALMEGEARSLPQRYHHASPLAQVGDGARVVCLHGDADDTVPLTQSERYVEAALRAGDPARLIVLPRTGHFELIDVRHPAWDACRAQILRMV